MDYAYKVTTHGRAVMAACMALEAAFRVTRVAFGSGRVEEETNLADVHQLLAYVSDGAVADKRHQDDRFELTIQYANSEHKDVPTFLLSEFLIYVEDPVTGEETDLLYGTLGDYRQPVPAYNPAYPPSVFNFPLTLILSDEINVAVSAPGGLVTWDDLAKAVTLLAVRRRDIVIPTTGWEQSGEDRYPLRLDIAMTEVTEAMTPSLTVLPEGEEEAVRCGLANRLQTLSGLVRLYARTAPGAPIPANLVLLGDSTGMILSDETGGTLPVASHTQLGGVILGPEFNITPSGVMSLNPEKTVTDEDLVDEAEVQKDVANILNGDGA